MKEILLAQYSSILNAYLEKPTETSLQQAYEFGRKALEQKEGLLQIAEVHSQALFNVLKSTQQDAARTALAASEILAASLAPFEMTHRGYEDAIQNLQRLNDELSQKANELQDANKEIDSFNYSVSHDLIAPLRSIVGFSKILSEEASSALNPSAMDSLNRIINAAKNMDSLVEALLGTSRLTKKEIVAVNVNLSLMAKEILTELQIANPEREVENIIAEDIVVNGDIQLLKVALTNLLSNAWKFTAKVSSAKIEFGTMNKDDKLAYFVRDNGAGFDMRFSERLFGPFQRLHSQNEFSGTGVGLSTVQRIIHRHGGQIWADAKVGGGATFYFTLK